MLSKITLQNFKVFKEKTEFAFSKINLLTGINGRGKSTLLQSLLLFKQSLEYNENTNGLILNGSCVNLGKFENVINVDSRADSPISIGFCFEIKARSLVFELKYNFLQEFENESVLIVKNCIMTTNKIFYNSRPSYFSDTLTSKEIEINLTGLPYEEKWLDSNQNIPLVSNVLNRFSEHSFDFGEPEFPLPINFIFSLDKIHYIGADRLGPQQFYSKTLLPSFVSVDKQGHNLATILTKKRKEPINEKLQIKESNYGGVDMFETESATLEFQVGNWIGFITDTNYCYVKAEDNSDYIVSLKFFFNKNLRNGFTPNNIGFGYSYILPIIISGLIAKPNEILIIENPEAHLHPRAQSRLAQFLSKVASTGVQVFIESHSEHILNALRIATLDEKTDLNNSDVKILYFQDNETQPYTELNLETSGKITNWVEGFFDQQEIDLATLFRLGRAKKS